MPISDFLKKLLSIPSVSGDESGIASWIITYIQQNKCNWKVTPEIYFG